MHHGWLATLESEPAARAPRRILHDLPLVAVSADADRLVVGFARPGDHLDHVVEHPVAVWRVRTSAGADLGIDVETSTAERLRLRFRSAMPVERVDGA
jgi:hypothetical protein